MEKEARIFVYGSTNICASCVGAPSSKETEEWLRAAIGRKFPDQPFQVEYVDIFAPQEETELKKIADMIVEEDYMYPVIVIDGEVIAEGNPRLKDIYAMMTDRGYQAV
ncbi:YuzD family protein [Listeria booriae]|uniref:YuzD family protein n=1 Tax=Listeria booriae TaxID=1552123 RepID=UPI001625F20A|nr:YuzD family protein [Listeria booriae]MBC2172332.1 YuzD family protein [Listeria booriae]